MIFVILMYNKSNITLILVLIINIYIIIQNINRHHNELTNVLHMLVAIGNI